MSDKQDPSDDESEAPATPRVQTPPPALVTRPTPEALRSSRREPTWEPEALGTPRAATSVGDVPEPEPAPLILVVDDKSDLRDSLRSALEDEGYRVAEAVNGYDACHRLLEIGQEVDLMFVDLMMPVLSGLDLIRLVVKSHLAHIPILVISGQPRPADLPEDFVFIKKGDFGPPGVLMAKVRHYIEKGRERRALARRGP